MLKQRELRQAYDRGQVVKGMSTEDVRSLWGPETLGLS